MMMHDPRGAQTVGGGRHTRRRASKGQMSDDDASSRPGTSASTATAAGFDRSEVFGVDPQELMGGIKEGRQRIERFHQQLIQSLEWSVQQRDQARIEAEGIGLSLSSRVIEMNDHLEYVMSQVDSEVQSTRASTRRPSSRTSYSPQRTRRSTPSCARRRASSIRRRGVLVVCG